MQTFLHLLPENLRTADIFRQEEKNGRMDFVENHKKYRKVGEKMDGQINFADKKVYNIHQNRWHGTCYI